MQEWMIAMLVISVMLIIRDMANTFFEEKTHRDEEILPPGESHPQKEMVQKYAASFQKLADTFYGMPYRTEFLSCGQLERIMGEVKEQVCSRCYQRELCWCERQKEMTQAGDTLIRTMEAGDVEEISHLRAEWMGLCSHSVSFLNVASEGFQKEKQNLIWSNRMIESRLAIAQQLTDISYIMKKVADDLYEICSGTPEFTEELKRALKKRRMLLKNVWVMDKVEGRRQVFLTIRTRSGQCISVAEPAQVLSEICGCSMIAVKGSRLIVNGEFHTIHFIEDVSYQMLYGVARLTKEAEKVSGDNYVCREEEEGRFLMCLSDGMGSGVEACKESEIVVELLEQFLESGFSQETAARMVNSALVLKGQDGMFSTVDICAVDLYTGVCSFLKAGASSTFIKRDHWVETVSAQSLAAGLMQQTDFETASRKLYHGDILIMMTDGVLDALPAMKEEETMKEIIMDIHEGTPKEIGRGILERVLGYSDYRARDDMTVLVAGMWKK